MTTSELNDMKKALKAELARRSGFGSMSKYAGSSYDFSVTPAKGGKILPEYGEKTVDLLLKIEDFKDLKLTKDGQVIPTAFSTAMTTEIARLAKEDFTGSTSEKSSCRGDCSGLCVGTCIGQCNGCQSCSGCSGCAASCGTGCASGCMTASA